MLRHFNMPVTFLNIQIYSLCSVTPGQKRLKVIINNYTTQDMIQYMVILLKVDTAHYSVNCVLEKQIWGRTSQLP